MRLISVFTLMIILYTYQYTAGQVPPNKTIIVKLIASGKTATQESALAQIREVTRDDLMEVSPVFPAFNRAKKNVPEKYNLSKFYKVQLSDATQIDYYIQEINRSELVEYAEAYPVSQIFDTPNDPVIPTQYNLKVVKAFDAFNFSKGDTTIVIGIVDSGVDLFHEDLKDNYKYNYNDPINNKDDDMDGYVDNFYGWDVADNDNNPQSLVNHNKESNYHGTRVAGIASAVTNNNIGIASLGYQTKLMPIKTMNSSGYIVAGYEGIVYAADHGCHIINCSWGNNFPSKFAQEVVNYAAEYRNCLVVAAAGNKSAAIDGRSDTWFYPASYQNVLSVGATGPDDMRWDGSSYAITLDVSAPGLGVYSTLQDSRYGAGSGTSFAAPLAAGLAGLVKAQRPEYNQQQLLEQIRVTSDLIDTLSENAYYSKQLGYGRINALRALSITDLPSIRISDFSIADNRMNALLAGDTLSVTFTATNYLAQASGTTVKLISNSDFLEPLANVFNTGKLGTFEFAQNNATPLLMKVRPNMPFNKNVWFIFEIEDEGYKDYQVFEVLLNRNYIDIAENKISTTLTSDGQLGYADRLKDMGSGFLYNNSTNILNYGGIIVANNNSAMASAILDVQEFSTLQRIDTSRTESQSLIGQTTYASKPETGLSLSITQSTEASNKELLESTLFYYYQVKNSGSEALNNLKMSQFADWDLNYYKSNLVVFDRSLNLFYTYSNSVEVAYAGICLLNDMQALPFGFDLIPGGIDISNGFSNELKWYTMNNERSYAGNNADTINVASMLTTDFFSLNPNDSIEIAFAHIVGNNYNDLINKTSAAREQYLQSTVHSHSSVENLWVYPNPATNSLNFSDIPGEEWKTISIMDSQGKVQLTQSNENQHNLRMDISGLKPGVYIVSCAGKKGLKVAKFIKTP